ncbi:MAG: hypothetical protein WC061_01815 [Melioribacteraceae bacterium]
MNRKKSFEISEELLDKIISVAYGDASLADRIKVMGAAYRNREVREILNKYKKTAGEVRALGEEEVPRELLKSIEIGAAAESGGKPGFLYDLLYVALARPLITASASVILIAAIVASLIINKPIQYNYSPGEIAAADKQAKYALALVGKIFKETHTTLEKEVLGNAVAKPFHQSAGIVNNLLEGDKNETN